MSKEKRKILFHIHNLRKGGAERVVVNLAAQFAKGGHEVLIVTEETAPDEYPLTEDVRRVNAGIVMKENPGILTRLSYVSKRKKKLREVILQERPDVVIAFMKSSNYRAVGAAKGICPVIVSVRNDPKIIYTEKTDAIFLKKYFYPADGCVFQTEDAKSFFKPEFQKKSTVIFNPINEKYFGVSPSLPREKTIVSVARIAKQKNPGMLVEAFMGLQKDFPEHKVLFYGADSGDGMMEQLKKQIEEANLQDRMLFCGTSNELEKLIVNAALFVMPSDYEGMPNALMEAMAMGLPVISTDCPCGGPKSLIEDGVNGLLIPVGDAKALAEAMRRVLSDKVYAEGLGREASKIKERASSDVIYRQWKDYIEGIIENWKA